MKRVTQGGDINFNVTDVRGLGDNYAFRFYTTDSCKYIVKVDGDAVEDIIRLEWDELKTLGDGVLCYYADNLAPDEDYSDGTFNRTFGGTTQWYIVTSCSGSGTSEEISELSDRLDAEIQRSTNVDTQQSGLISENTLEIHNLGDRLYSDTYTKSEVNQKIAEASYDDTALSNRVTANETALANTYRKNETYSRSEVNDLIAGIDVSGDAVGVQSIEQTTTSTESGGINVITSTLTDGTTSTFQIRNGLRGEKGDTGNVQVDGNGNVLIVNNLTEGGTGAALSAEMGKWLAVNIGTFAEAWVKSKITASPFTWLWSENDVDGSPIQKPIWHVGNSNFIDASSNTVYVMADAVPNAPTINLGTQPVNGKVPKNTQVRIIPSAESVLYYSVDGGTTYYMSDREVSLTLELAENISIKAYCENNKGDSGETSLSVTVEGTPVPTMPLSGSVERGGYVTISVEQGGELHYSTDGINFITADGLSVNIQVPSEGVTIYAYNVQDNEQSTTISANYTIKDLMAPTFNYSSGTEFPAAGGFVELYAIGNNVKIFYNLTTDNSEPANPDITSTEYSGAISVNTDTKIKAIAHDDWGYSAISSANYTVQEPKIVINSNGPTTMSLGDTGLTELTINEGINEFTPRMLNVTSFADHTFSHLKFNDVSKILTFDGGGAKFADLGYYGNGTNGWGAFKDAVNLTSAKGIKIDGGSISNAFRGTTHLTELEISGTISGEALFAFNAVGWLATSGCTAKILVNGTPTNLTSALSYCKIPTLTIANLSTADYTIITNMVEYTRTTNTLICTTNEPPIINANANWLAILVNNSSNLQIKVPFGSLNAYISNSVWGQYASQISEIINN